MAQITVNEEVVSLIEQLRFLAGEIEVSNAVENAARKQADEAYQQRDLDTNIWSLFAPVRAATKVSDELYDRRQYLALELAEAILSTPTA